MLSWHNQLPLLSYQLFATHPNVGNVVSTRLGGVSTPPYHELNLSLSAQDDRDAVLENRRRLCAAVDVTLESLTLGQLKNKPVQRGSFFSALVSMCGYTINGVQ